jgi:hypothetical protein
MPGPHKHLKTGSECRERILMLASKLIKHRSDIFFFVFWISKCPKEDLWENQVEIWIVNETVTICIKYAEKWTKKTGSYWQWYVSPTFLKFRILTWFLYTTLINCLSVCLLVCFSCFSVFPVCLSVCMFVLWTVLYIMCEYWSFCTSICFSACTSTFALSVCLSVCLSMSVP